MYDILIAEFDANYNLKMLRDSRQRAENWVKLDTGQSFWQYGVKYTNYVLSEEKTAEIPVNALALYVQQELSKNAMTSVVTIAEAGKFEVNFNIKVLE